MRTKWSSNQIFANGGGVTDPGLLEIAVKNNHSACGREVNADTCKKCEDVSIGVRHNYNAFRLTSTPSGQDD